MFPYLLIILLHIILVYCFDIKNQKSNKVFFEYLCVVVLICFAGLRFHIGSDSIQYEEVFYSNDNLVLSQLIGSSIFKTSSQPLWLLLMSFCRTISESFVFFQFVHAAIFNILLFSFVRKTTSKVFTVFLVLFLTSWHTFNFEVLRESLAIVFYLHALLSLKKRKYVQYFLLAIIGSLFHTFAFIMFVITPILYFFPSKYTFPILIIASIVLFYFAREFDTTVAYLMVDSASGFMSEDIISKFEAYTLKGNREGFTLVNIFGIVEVVVLYVVLPIIILIRLYKKDDSKLFIPCIVLYILFSILQTRLMIVYRFKNYCLIPLIVCMVNCLYDKSFGRQLSRVLFVPLVYVYILWGAYNFYRPDERLNSGKNVMYDTRYFPYVSVFDKP